MANNLTKHKKVDPFTNGTCTCGAKLWASSPDKYASGSISPWFGSAKDRVWTWLCKRCGLVHEEKARIIEH